MRLILLSAILLLAVSVFSPLPVWAAKPAPPPVVYHRTLLALNDNWQCALELDGAAPREQWAKGLPEQSKTVRLPLSWAHHPLYRTPESAEWYSRTVTLPQQVGDAGALLVIDNPVGMLDIYFDGTHLGSFLGNGFTRRVVVHGAPGSEHRITLRLSSTELPEAIRSNAACCLGPLSLEVLPPVRVESCLPLMPPSASNVTIRYRLAADVPCAATLTLALLAHDTNRVLAHQSIPVELIQGSQEGERKLAVKGALRWDPEKPNLYRVRATLAGPDGVGDTWEASCGACESTVDRNGLRINGRPVLLKGLRLPGGFPLLSQPTLLQTLESEFALVRQAGYNAIMADGAAWPAQALEVADRLGLLVIGEIPPGTTADGQQVDISTAVEEMGAHPCVVAWSWTGSDMSATDVARLHKLDPYRPVLVRNDVHSRIVLSATATDRAFTNVDMTNCQPAPAAGTDALHQWERSEQPVLVSGIGVDVLPGQPVVNSITDDHSVPAAGDAFCALPGARTTEEQALADIRSVVESMRRSENALGYFVRPLRGSTFTGLSTSGGIPSGAFTNAVSYNQSCIIALRTMPATTPQSQLRLDAAVINDALKTGNYRLYQVLTQPDGKTVISEKEFTLGSKRVQDISALTDIAARQPGEYRVQLLLSGNTGVIASTGVLVVRVQ